jgi:hypothetical protein
VLAGRAFVKNARRLGIKGNVFLRIFPSSFSLDLNYFWNKKKGKMQEAPMYQVDGFGLVRR